MDGRYPRPVLRFLLRTGLSYITLFVVRLTTLTAQSNHTLHIVEEPSSPLEVGEEFEVRVEARDENGDPDADFNPTIELSLLGGVLEGDTSEKVDNNGVARFDKLSIGLGGTFRIVATGGPATPDTSNALVVSALPAVELQFDQQPSNAEAGATISPSITVKAVDLFGQTDPDFTGNITIAIGNNPGGGTLSGTTTVAAQAGVATFSTLSIDKVGSGYTLTATSSGFNPENSETFAITPGNPSGATSQITAAPTSIPADGSSTSTITVELRDAEDNPLTDGGDNVVLSTTAGSLSSVLDLGNGAYQATLTASSSAETATITGTVNGNAITDDATVTFTAVGPGPPSGATSQITASPTSIPANGTSTSTITVQLRDAAGTPLTTGGATVVLSTTAGSLGSVADLGNGSYQATLTSSSSVSTVIATVSGTVNGSAITDDATVTFTGVGPGPPSGATSQITASPTSIPADGTSTSTITVALRDAAGNPLTTGGATVTLSTTAGTLGSVSDNGDGTYEATLTSSSSSTNVTATVTGTVNGNAITDNATVTFTGVGPGPPSGTTSQITAAPTSIPANGTSTSTVTVQLRDAAGMPLNTGGANVALSTTAGSLSSVFDNGNGTYNATLTSTSSTTNVVATISGTVNGNTITDTATVTFTGVAPVATRLLFTQQPTQTQAGAAIAPPVTVRAVTNTGTTVTSFTGNITIAIGNNPGAGTLSGTTTVAAVNGVATFNNLSINRTGNGYTLTASANGLAGATSNSFPITPGAPAQTTSQITASPTSVPADGASTSAITVELFDAFGNRITTGGANISLSTTAGALGPVTDLGNGTYTATLTAPSAPATAPISGSIGGGGGGSIADTATVTFTMVPPNTLRLEFVQQPGNTQAGLAISPPVTVRVVDLAGATVTSFNGEVTIALSVNPAGGTLAGTTTVTAVNGVATFNSLSIARAGAGYRLAVGASGITGATSDAFTITPGPPFGPTTQITAAPASIPADGTSTSTITVEVRDAQGNRRLTGGDVVTLSTTLGTLSAVTDLGNGLYSATLRSSTTGGTATISGTVAGTTIVDTATVEFTSSGPAPATGLAFVQQPSNAQAGASISPPVTVRAIDGTGATATSFIGNITIAIGLNPTGAVLSGTTTVAAVAGVATFSNLSVDRAGGYTLVANATGLTSATSSAFAVTAGPPPTTADLAVTASVDDGTPAVGDTVIYTIRVTNQGPAQATGVQVSYDLGDRMSFLSSVPTQGSYNPQTEIWTVGTLEPGAGATLEISARVQR